MFHCKDLLRPNAPYPWKRQYPLKPEALEGLRPLVNKYRDTGILITCESPCNTPILPVKKPDVSYRFVQDLRAVNEAVVPIHPIVPNPYTLLSQVPGNAEYFSVFDLKDAFFCIPLHSKSPKPFAFEWRGLGTREVIQLCWTRLPQGFRDSPRIFGTSLGRELRELTNSNLIQYVDDLLISSPDFTSSQMDTIKTLNFLYEKGYWVTPKKAQISLTQVKYLGFIIMEGKRMLDPQKKSLILNTPYPQTKKTA